MAPILTRTATAASKLQGISKTYSTNDEKLEGTTKLTHDDGKSTPVRNSSPDSPMQTEKQRDQNTHQRFVLTDPVAFRFVSNIKVRLGPILT